MIVVFELNLLPIFKKRKKRKEKIFLFCEAKMKAKENAIKCYLYVCPWVSNTVSLLFHNGFLVESPYFKFYCLRLC